MPPVTETSQNDGNIAVSNDALRPANGGANRQAIWIVLGVLIAAMAGIAYYKTYSGRKSFNLQEMKGERLTRSGKAAVVAVSPDGQTVAYVLRGAAEQSVMLQKLGTGQDVQLLPPGAVMYSGLAFAPDGASLYFTASSKGNELYSSLYRLPLQGGTPAKLVDDIDTAVSFSPDGKKFAFVRGVPDKHENDLLTANVDGSDLKVVARKPGQVYAASLIAPAWSPDGNTIVFTNYQATNRRALVAVAPDGSGLREVYRTHDDLGRPLWLPDGSAVVVPVREGKLGDRGQLWQVQIASGQAQRISNDARDYGILWVGLSANARALATIETTITGDLWLLPDSDSSKERQLTMDGALVIYVAQFGRDKILYETRDGHVFTANADGGNAQQVKMGTSGTTEVSACGDGKHIVYSESSGEAEEVWRTDANGANTTQLTHVKSATMPNCSPDGEWVIYWNDEERSFYRISIEGGNTMKVNLPSPSDPYVRISPDGKYVAYTAGNEGPAIKEYSVVIAPSTGGTPTKTFPMVPGMGMAPPQWSPDGHAMYFNLMKQGASNIWKMETPGGELKQVTNFPSGLIASYAWSADGKSLYVARGTRSSDVLLLKRP